MIVPESRLRELFATLPGIEVNSKTYNPVFEHGTQRQIYAFLKSKQKEVKYSGGNVYPLIWMLPPFDGAGDVERRVTLPLNLVLCTLSTSELSNVQRAELSFRGVLYPLLGNIIKALTASNFTRITSRTDQNEVSVNTSRFYNYGSDNEQAHESTDIWDAMRVEMEIEMTNRCIRSITY